MSITPKEVRDRIIEGIIAEQLTAEDAAKELNIRPQQVRGWVKTWRRKRTVDNIESEYQILKDNYEVSREVVHNQGDRIEELEREVELLTTKANTNEAAMRSEQAKCVEHQETIRHLQQRLNEAMVERRALLAQLAVQYNQISQVHRQLVDKG